MIKILGIVIVVIGAVLFVNGIRAMLGKTKMKENDFHSRFYVGTKEIFGGLLAIFLGIILFLTY